MNTHRNRLNTTMSNQDVQDVESALDMLETKLSFLVTITEDERDHSVRLGPHNWNFVRDAKEAYDDMPGLLPRFVDIDEYENDLALLHRLRPFSNRLSQFVRHLEDTSILLGNLAYKDSLAIMHSAQDAAKRGVTGAQMWSERLGKRFINAGNRTNQNIDSGTGASNSTDDGGGNSTSDTGTTGGTNTGGTGSTGNPTGGSDTGAGNIGSTQTSTDNGSGSNNNPDADSGNPSTGGSAADSGNTSVNG